VDPILQKEASY